MHIYYEAAANAGVDKNQLAVGTGELGIWVGRTHDVARKYVDQFMRGHEWETYVSYGWLIDDREHGRNPSFASGDYRPGIPMPG